MKGLRGRGGMRGGRRGRGGGRGRGGRGGGGGGKMGGDDNGDGYGDEMEVRLRSPLALVKVQERSFYSLVASCVFVQLYKYVT